MIINDNISKNLPPPPKLRWNLKLLAAFIDKSLLSLQRRKKCIGENSPWWTFIYSWHREKNNSLVKFINGSYRFEPLNTYVMKDEVLTVWSYDDRLFVRALLFLIKPLFKHIISPKCLHLNGPSGVRDALNLTKKALNTEKFRYFIRADIKSYYASIDRKILVNQTKEYFKDERVLDYLEQIITIPVIKNGVISTPSKGIHRRSSLSPLLGALYLSPLDQIFEKATGVYYIRFMDDIVILTKTKRQFCKAKRRLQQVLAMLKLQLSKRKTKMGVLTQGFHFLGVNIKINPESSEAPIITASEKALVKDAVAQTQLSQSQVSITLHERCCVRAMDKVVVMQEDAVHPEKMQRYLSRWAAWWARTASPIRRNDCLYRLSQRAQVYAPELSWLSTGLLYLHPGFQLSALR